MKFAKALRIIDSGLNPGFMVTFEWKNGNMLRSDYFPDKHAGEKLIETEREAWKLAQQFAAKTKGKCINIYVARGDNLCPVFATQTKPLSTSTTEPTSAKA